MPTAASTTATNSNSSTTCTYGDGRCPGHTPETMCYTLAIADAPDRTWGVFTGDTMFIGDTGRTDLIDADKRAESAGRLYDHVNEKVLSLGGQALVLPAHGAGFACGGNVADRDHSTIGIERVSNVVAVKSREHSRRTSG